MKRVATVVGARPQFIKAAVLQRALKHVGNVQELMIHTGQHYDTNMSHVFFEELQIDAPAHHLGIGSASHGAQTGRMLAEIEGVLVREQPDLVVVYGDTNSTVAAALAASKLQVPVAHVEAGLRSFNRRMPEEINRIVTDHVSDLLFAPTKGAVQHLADEGIRGDRVHEVGDVMFDAVLQFSGTAALRHPVSGWGLKPGSYALCTIHRQENTASAARLLGILDGLRGLASEIPVVIPLHPRTKAAVEVHGLGSLVDSLHVLPPVSYFEMLSLSKSAFVILTDSGGLQKEAYFHGVPCITLRDETEWVETLEDGWNTLAGSDPERIRRAINGVNRHRTTTREGYGAGRASTTIAEVIASWQGRPRDL